MGQDPDEQSKLFLVIFTHFRLNLLGRNRLENEQTQHHKQDYKDAKDTLEVRLETCQGQTYAQLRWESSQRLSKNSTAAALV